MRICPVGVRSESAGSFTNRHSHCQAKQTQRRYGLRLAARRCQLTTQRLRGVARISSTVAQYTSIRFTETVVLECLVAWIGSISDAYDNAAPNRDVPYENETIKKNSPSMAGALKTFADVESVT